jgi:hypothetical protein
MTKRSQRANPKAAAVLVVALAVVAGSGAASSPDAVVSANWAGYVAVGPGSTSDMADSTMAFTDVTGQWVQPQVTCKAGWPSSLSIWVGLGGYSMNARALEQVGSEADCDASGNAAYSVWYELVPSEPVTVSGLKIRPGDVIASSVVVDATGLLVQVIDRTRRRRFTRHLAMASPDLSSAEWIAEAPSRCAPAGACRQTSLAKFAPFWFTRSFANGNGVPGTISSPTWRAVPLRLVPRSDLETGGAGQQASRGGSAGAEPSALTADGSGFTLSWQASPAPAAG